MNENARSNTKPESCGGNRLWSLLALGLAVIGSVGSIYLSVGLGLKACPLCFYQRTFMMGAASIFLVMQILESKRPGLASCLALPLVAGGLGVAGFHVYLEVADKLECPPGVLGIGNAPQQSLVAFSVLLVATVLAAWSGRCESRRQHPLGWVGLLILGAVMAAASIKSSPPLPPVPAQPYDPVTQPFEMCRPPFRGA